jgi:hypothetical protein
MLLSFERPAPARRIRDDAARLPEAGVQPLITVLENCTVATAIVSM